MMKSSQIGARKQAAVSCAELRIIFCKFAAVISSCLTLHPTGEVTATNSHWCLQEADKEEISEDQMSPHSSGQLNAAGEVWHTERGKHSWRRHRAVFAVVAPCRVCTQQHGCVHLSQHPATKWRWCRMLQRKGTPSPLTSGSDHTNPLQGLEGRGGGQAGHHPMSSFWEVWWLGCEPGTSCWLAPAPGSACRFVRLGPEGLAGGGRAGEILAWLKEPEAVLSELCPRVSGSFLMFPLWQLLLLA